MLGYRGNSLQLIHSRRDEHMPNMWKREQKNGENDESPPLLLLCMSCDGSLSGF